MKKALTFLVTALIPVLAATMTPSCAGGESVPNGGSGGSNGSGGSGDNGTGGDSSSTGGKVGTGGSSSSSGGKTGSGGSNSSSGGSSSSSGGKTGSGGSNSSSGGSSSSSGGSTGTGGSSSSTGGATGTGTGGTTSASCATDATMSVMNGLATSGTWTGYAYTFAGTAPATVTPICPTPCFMTAAKQLCVSGSVGPDTTNNASAGFGWNIGGTTTTATPVAIAPGGTGLAYNVQGLTTQMRFQVTDGAGVAYCADITAVPSGTIPWAMFTKECYKTPPGVAYAATVPISKVEIVVPSDSGTARPFCFCVLNLGAAP